MAPVSLRPSPLHFLAALGGVICDRKISCNCSNEETVFGLGRRFSSSRRLLSSSVCMILYGGERGARPDTPCLWLPMPPRPCCMSITPDRAALGIRYCGFAGAPGRTAATPFGLMLKGKNDKGTSPRSMHEAERFGTQMPGPSIPSCCHDVTSNCMAAKTARPKGVCIGTSLARYTSVWEWAGREYNFRQRMEDLTHAANVLRLPETAWSRRA